MRIGFVGAGRMGRPMVDRLVAAGHEVRVLGRTPDARSALAEAGAVPVAELAAVADRADVVGVCVLNDAQVREVCIHSGLPASTLVVHTTGSPRTVADIAARGFAVVDAPVSGGPHDVAAGRVTVLVGGAVEDVDRVRPMLAAYGDPILHVGGLGAGQQVKLINNALFAAHIGLLADAVRVASEFGIDEHVLLTALPHGSAASRALSGAAVRRSVAGFTTAVREFLAKDVAVVREVAAESGVDLGAIAAAIDAGQARPTSSAEPSSSTAAEV